MDRDVVMRDINKGVLPLSVKETMAFIVFKWLAEYTALRATVSLTELKDSSILCFEIVTLGWVSAPTQTRAIACTVSTGYSPAAVSADNMTASVPSSP